MGGPDTSVGEGGVGGPDIAVGGPDTVADREGRGPED